MTKTVSFDFDMTLWDESEQIFIPETVALLKKHLLDGSRVIIVTGRVEKYCLEARKLLADKLNLKLEVFSAPGSPGIYSGSDMTKSDVLIYESASIHFDDIPFDTALDEARDYGVSIQLPPQRGCGYKPISR